MTTKIPTKYENADLSLIKPGLLPCVEGMVKNMRKNKGFYLWGKPGVGKTFTAWAIYKHFIELKKPIMLVKSSRIIECIKATFLGINEESKPYYEELDEIKEFQGIVIFDDIGADKYPEGVITKYFEIIDYRYEWVYPMSFTSNVSLNELKSRVGERIVSRISEICEVFELEEENKRV